MQAIVKYFGAKLFKVNGHVKTRHKVNYYCPILKKNIKRTINSYHDYGVSTSEASKSFDIITSYKNTAEFIRHKEKKIFGIMWHPERERLFNEYDIMLIKNYLNIKMNIFILAAGKGTRLGIHNKNNPKCLFKVGKLSLIERNLIL